MRLVGRGRGAGTNRSWAIASDGVMNYRLVDGDGTMSGLERSVREELDGFELSSRDIAEAIGAPVGSVRNLLTRLMARGRVVAEVNGRERIYQLA